MLNSKRNLYRQTLGRTRSVLELVSSLIGSYKTNKVNIIKQCKQSSYSLTCQKNTAYGASKSRS